MAAGVILLGEVAARTETITISYRVCDRRGRRRTDRLLAEHGPDMPIPDLLRLLAAGCGASPLLLPVPAPQVPAPV